jgi:signal transduction histidine kinase
VRFAIQLGGAGRDRGRWLVPLFLLIGVLAPTVCVLWFMNVAVNNQRDASRRKLADAYRGQLTLLRERVDSYWEKRASDLEREPRDGPAPAVFEHLVAGGLADSAICLNRDGSVAYPSIAMAMTDDPVSKRGDWMAAQALESWGDLRAAAAAYAAIAGTDRDISVAARAAQARIRCLVRSGDKHAALRAVEENFGGARLGRGTDIEGRLIAADEQLLAIHLVGGEHLGGEDARYVAAVRKLHGWLADYAGAPMPAAQRLYLMEEMRALPMGPAVGDFPTYAAERLAARFLEAGFLEVKPANAGEAGLEPSGVPETWKLTPPGGRTIALYRTATVQAVVRGLTSGQSVAFSVTPPGGAPPSSDWMPAGPRLPGWQISLSLAGSQPFDEIARRQTASYLWVAILGIAVVAITALIAGEAFRRQWRVTRLKTDLVAAVSHELKTPLASMRLLVDTLLDDHEADARKTREYLELISRENFRLSRLIDNFLTFSRLERNRQKFEFRATAPEDVVKTAIDAAQERFQTPGCRLEVNVNSGLPPVRADEDALVTVLLNLLDNAYKYTPGEKRIGLRAFSENGGVVFAVEDNGIGIAPREQKRIFRRFYQVDRRLAGKPAVAVWD